MKRDPSSVLVVSVAPYTFATRSRKAARAYGTDHKVRFVAFAAAGRAGRWDRAGSSVVDGIEIEQVAVRAIATKPGIRSMLSNLVGSYLPAVGRMARDVWADRSDVVHVADPTLAFLGIVHKVRNRSFFVLDIPERPGRVHAPGSLASVFSRLQPLYLRVAARLVDLATVVVPGDLQQVRDYGFSEVLLVRNVPLAAWRAPYTDPPGRRADTLHAVVAGSIFEGRGYEMVIDAVARARQSGTEVRLTVCGPSREDYVESLKQRARDRGVSQQIDWLPPVPSESVSQLYLNAEVGLVLYESNDPGNDGLSNKIMEAVTSGRPVLAGALPENKRFVEQYRCGWNVPMDVDSLTDALVRVAQIPDLTQIARHCRSLGDEELRWDSEFAAVLRAAHGVDTQSETVGRTPQS